MLMATQVKRQESHRLWQQGNTLSLNPSAPSCAYDLVFAIARTEGTKGG